MTREEYIGTLADLATMLRAKPMTARQICAECECSKPVAYARLEALRKQGATFYTTEIRERPTGPKATAWGIR